MSENIAPLYSQTFINKFWSKVEKTDNCWLWKASTANGYGQTGFLNDRRKAHRVSWELVHGEIPKSKVKHDNCILHKCDNKLCVNPDHLFIGTQLDNMKDMISKVAK